MISVERLADFLRPGGVAIVGATDRSPWSQALYRNLTTIGRQPVWLVNPHRDRVHDQPAVPSLADIDGDVQLACLIVRAEHVLDNLAAAAASGIRNAIVIASGFQEAGLEGRKRAAELADLAAEHHLTVLGPNTSGMINVAADYAPFGSFLEPPLAKGRVGIVLQSGGLASQVVRLSQARGVGVSAVVATGNESVVSTSAAIEYFVHDPGTAAVAAFLEDVKDVPTFRRAALAALEAGKPIVALKVGRTPAGRKAALSHTGAVVGDDTAVDAAFAQLGVIRVKTLEELLATAGLIAGNRPISGRRMGVLAPSGGFCDIVADGASDAGLELPDFAPDTVAQLAELLPYYGEAKNPLDVTGMIVSDRSIAGRALAATTEDPGIDFVLYPSPLPYTNSDEGLDQHRPALEQLAATMAASPVPVVLQYSVPTNISAARQQLLAEAGLYVSIGIDVTLTALGAAAGWAERRSAALAIGLDRLTLGPQGAAPDGRLPDGAAIRDGGDAETWSEARAREFLQAAGVPVVPGGFVTDATGAARVAAGLGGPVAVKVVSGAIAHKSDIGGVELGMADPDEAAAAFERVTARAAAIADVEGALVTAMRPGGTELLVAVTVDAHWGPMLTVGLGGIWVEAFADTRSALLPMTRAEIVQLCLGLRGARLLTGPRRDGQGVDLDRLAQVVERIAEAALTLGDRLHTAEINPVWASGADVEVLDALIVTNR
jgi:acyl-CoA synthetase (NDP forming)